MLIAMVMLMPFTIKADTFEPTLSTYSDEVFEEGDVFSVGLLLYSSYDDGEFEISLMYDSNVLEFVGEEIFTDYTKSNNVVSEEKGKYVVSYEYDISSLTEGIPALTTYKFKVVSDEVDQTSIYLSDYDSSITIDINADDKSNDDLSQDIDNEEENNIPSNTNNGNDIINYVIIALLSAIMVLLVVLICIMIKNNKKRVY